MKALKITYWSSTIFISLTLALSCFMYFTKNPGIVQGFEKLGYPLYLLNMLGTAKMISIPILLIPKFDRLKEWVYAGLSFDFIAALWSHLIIGDTAALTYIPPIMLGLALSYITHRKLVETKLQH